ncbi:MotA/TolQ/ExbB proton channel family protein [Psychrobium sp. 1_MG-2023]|uniref:MotA/TolQ/ExbB proton channel family protein n=1 Tax=Psychrobium sp. 1_MG-2023 TaxID=3062624 RepID=UPI000C32B629|nr:MotA/TolQ/ExbB proton channel family protein [Psychrobium sp. 1_MG-2023]MDP2562579.1 MotA/TolQ/ExbB proton channel family protein [Psychrobium sp. 1_MG-2023]PKF59654.1 MotA/TolQ/ExbB proton channel family protein [Alteromonadales bacterium alter-6D02]
MKKGTGSEFIFQLFSLLLSIIIVHAVYVTVIRPNAQAISQQQQMAHQTNQSSQTERSIYVVLKDFEQETCFVLMLWALLIMAYKARITQQERYMLNQSMLNVQPGVSILPQDARELCRPLQNLPQNQREMLAPRTLLIALQRFNATANVDAVASAVKNNCDSETDKLDSELAMVRYIVWAIPSIGFIGTVRGIGEALGLAHEAVQGNIIGVTNSLGTAFNSTFIALVISIVIMFFSHQLQLMQERLVQSTQDYCDNNLLNHLLIADVNKEES